MPDIAEPYNTCYTAEREDTHQQIWFGIGSGGTNRGVYYNTLDDNNESVIAGDWALHVDANNTVFLNHILMTNQKQGSATKVGNYWTSGAISFLRRGNVVHCQASPAMTAMTGRVTFATIPVGFRPYGTVYAHENGSDQYYLLDTTGAIQNGISQTAGNKYFSVDYLAKD